MLSKGGRQMKIADCIAKVLTAVRKLGTDVDIKTLTAAVKSDNLIKILNKGDKIIGTESLMYRYDFFRFMAFSLEGETQPKGDIETLYGITKKNYPKEFEKIKKALELNDKKKLDETILEVYDSIYENFIAHQLPYPVNFIAFDHYFNTGKVPQTVKILQAALNYVENSRLKVDGIYGKHTKTAVSYIHDPYLVAICMLFFRIGHYITIHLSMLNEILKKEGINEIDREKLHWIKGWYNRIRKIMKYILEKIRREKWLKE